MYLACTSNSAPTLMGAGLSIVDVHYYYYSCNVSPRSVGVTKIQEGMHAGDDFTPWGLEVTRAATQQSAATMITFCNMDGAWCKSHASSGVQAIPGGTYKVTEVLELDGNFAYGKDRGCQRVTKTSVVCLWRSATTMKL